MFNNKKNNNSSMEAGKSQNRIGHGTTINGDVVSDGGFRIDGVINGTLKTPGKVVIGKDGKIDGTLECNNADVEGVFSGTLVVNGLLSLKSTANIQGDVSTQKLAVEPGATFNASCKMDAPLQPGAAGKKGKTA
ncbi:polymer-forming cytoskeletal protein [uncultured Nonlabens sp.]|uniref:bactofilin family protein n=1 Tax=uncultured Nonlabens sp. TaxID=859306 RepID=UPI002601C67E|nr:polymer-forming cytoskeletal protein [uncultured Nonlabens sp.]